jgi:hypothetical protein
VIVISMLLVVVGFVTLVLGILEYGAEPLYFIYASIGSCILAGVFLIAGVLRSRPSRKEAPAPAEEASATGWPPASGPTTLLSQDTGVDASDATPPSPRPADQQQDAETWRPTPSTAQPETGSQSRPGVLATPSDEPEPAGAEPEPEPGLLATPPDEPEPAGAEPEAVEAEPEPAEAEPEPAATEATEPEPAAGEHTAETQTADAAPHTEEAGKAEATGGEQVPPAPDLSAEKATGGAKKTTKKATGGAKKTTKKATGGAKKTTEKATGGAKKTAKKAAGGAKKSTKKATGGAKKTASQAASSSTAGAQDETRRIAQALNGLEGCGLAQHRSLAQRFGSYDELLAASIADLADVAGISESLAQRIHERLHG